MMTTTFAKRRQETPRMVLVVDRCLAEILLAVTGRAGAEAQEPDPAAEAQALYPELLQRIRRCFMQWAAWFCRLQMIVSMCDRFTRWSKQESRGKGVQWVRGPDGGSTDGFTTCRRPTSPCSRWSWISCRWPPRPTESDAYGVGVSGNSRRGREDHVAQGEQLRSLRHGFYQPETLDRSLLPGLPHGCARRAEPETGAPLEDQEPAAAGNRRPRRHGQPN